MQYQGSCHCGKLKFEAEGEIKQVIACNCSYCARKGSLLWFVPRANFTFRAGENESTVYQFNKHVIAHHFCPACGCQPYAFGTDPSGKEMAAINTRCLEGVDTEALPHHAYDGKHS